MKNVNRSIQKVNATEEVRANLTKNYRSLAKMDEEAMDKIRTLIVATNELERIVAVKEYAAEEELKAQERKCLHYMTNEKADLEQTLNLISGTIQCSAGDIIFHRNIGCFDSDQETDLKRLTKDLAELKASSNQGQPSVWWH